MMDEDEAEALTASVGKYGLRKLIKLYADGSILDGRNRYYACLASGIEPLFEEWAEFDDTDPRVYVVIHNVHRRHLSVGFRARLASSLVTTTHGGDRSEQEANSPLGGKPKRTREDAARICFVGVRRLGDVAFIRNHAEPEVIAKFEADKMTLGRAKMLAKETAEAQRDAPDVRFAGPRKPKPPDPPTGPTTREWIKMGDDDKLHFRKNVDDPWYDEFLERQEKTPLDESGE